MKCSTWKHGISLRTLLRKTENIQGPCLLVCPTIYLYLPFQGFVTHAILFCGIHVSFFNNVSHISSFIRLLGICKGLCLVAYWTVLCGLQRKGNTRSAIKKLHIVLMHNKYKSCFMCMKISKFYPSCIVTIVTSLLDQGTNQTFVFTTIHGEPRLFRPTGKNSLWKKNTWTISLCWVSRKNVLSCLIGQ